MEKFTTYQNTRDIIQEFNTIELTDGELAELKSFFESVFGVYMIRYIHIDVDKKVLKINASYFNYDEVEYGIKIIGDFLKKRFGIKATY